MTKWNDVARLPLNSLRAFAAVHETGSVGAAANALSVTHGAVSQHLRSLEDRLQCTLFARSGKRLVMAPDAADLAESLLGHLKAIAGDVERFRRDETVLNITVTPHFAQHWLLPHLGEFVQSHPEIDLRINADATMHDLAHGDFDAAVRHGDGNWPGLTCKKLLESRHVVVAAPAVLKSVSIQTPQDLTRLPWILDEDRDGEMSDWFEEHGLAGHAHLRITRLPSALTLAAAMDGHGVAWLPYVYAAPHLTSGRLVQVLDDWPGGPSDIRHYYLCWDESRDRHAFRIFRQWITRKVREEADAARRDQPPAKAAEQA